MTAQSLLLESLDISYKSTTQVLLENLPELIVKLAVVTLRCLICEES
jgi:hypothetical protein